MPHAESAIDLHLGHLSNLQGLFEQLHDARYQAGHDSGCILEITGTCVCQQVHGFVAALQEAVAHHTPLDATLLLDIIRVLGSIGAALVIGAHPLSAPKATRQALHRCASGMPQQTMVQLAWHAG
jgi:hypothetical protein